MDNKLYVWEPPVLIAECLSPANRKGPVEELLPRSLAAQARRTGLRSLRRGEPRHDVHPDVHPDVTQTDGVVSLGMAMLWRAFHGQ